MERNTEMLKSFVGRERKVQAVFSPFVLLRGTEGVVQNWNGKTCAGGPAKRVRSGGLEWKGCKTSTGLGESRIRDFF